MHSRTKLILRVVTGVLVVGVIVVAGLIVTSLFNTDKTPQNMLERAVYAAEEAVRANPESVDARIKLSAAYTESGAFNAAIEQAQIAARLDPANAASYYALGLAQSGAGKSKEAIENLTKAATTTGQLAGFYADVWAALATSHDRGGDTAAAISDMDKALDSAPENSEYLYLRGSFYEKDSKWADALYDYYQATSYVPDHAASLDGIKRVTKSHPEAVAEMEKMFQVDAKGSDVATSTPAK